MSAVIPMPREGDAGNPFDGLRHIDHAGIEWWSARELMPHLGYDRWERFYDAAVRARQAAENSGAVALDHVRDAAKMVGIGSGAVREVFDFHLTRYGAYLVAMNGDPRKTEIAAAQTYFAIKTREAEAAASGPVDHLTLAENILAALRAEQRRVDVLEAKVEAIEGRHDHFTALGYAKLTDRPTGRPYLAKVGKRATSLLRERGEEPQKRQDATFGTINVYPSDVLEEAFEAVRS